ncbi:MAG: hypothetical protein KF869_07970 [Phycisphaeraceae bacterium]|nr:hypothetical protein [Phycisphaeraceae bacterium]
MTALPTFNSDGVLPPGDYPLSLHGLMESMLVLGPGEPRDHMVWNAAWRQRLAANLSVMVRQLWAVGIEDIYIDGSFAEDKDHPNDIDGYFACDPKRFASGQLEQELNRIDPQKSWTWDHTTRRAYRGYPKLQLPMWHAYRVELYPHYTGLIAGRDEHGQELEFPAFFRKCRGTGKAKGIIKIIKDEKETGVKP